LENPHVHIPCAHPNWLDLHNLVDAIRFNPVAITMFTVGLLMLGVGPVLAAVAIWRSGALPRCSGILQCGQRRHSS
jgi:hypothetical protein